MINWNFNPELINFGIISIRYYSIIYILGFIITLFYLENLRKKGKLDLTKEKIYDLIFYLIIGVVLGARLFEVLFWNPKYYFNNLIEIFMIWEGGLSFHGGLIGAFIVLYLFSKKNNLNFFKLLDQIIIPSTLALSLGRIGNLFNSEIYGTSTNVLWCFNFLNVENCRHPYQIYSSLGHLITFFILLKLNKKERKDGFIFFIGILLISLSRFLLDFFREDEKFFSLSLGQHYSIPLILISAYFLFRNYNK